MLVEQDNQGQSSAVTFDDLRRSALFNGMPDEQLRWVLEHSSEVRLETGDLLYTEGQAARFFHVLLEGELEVTRFVDGHNVVLNKYAAGAFTGEMSLLLNVPNLTSVRALCPCRVLRMDKVAFGGLIATSPVASAMLPVMAKRIQSADILVHQRSKLAALGKIAAGLAHELNNPAAAAHRAAEHLNESFQILASFALQFSRQPLSTEQWTALSDLHREIVSRPEAPVRLDPMEASDREDALMTWLDDHDVANGWEIAPTLVKVGIDAQRLEKLYEDAGPDLFADALAWLHGTLQAAELLDEIRQSTGRISSLVSMLKSYTYMDQAPLQQVDIHEGLESTLVILRNKLNDIEVTREYAPDLPRIYGYGSELNQVWTNLIDNAIAAVAGQERPQIWLRTRRDEDYVVVEVADNGSGIAPESQSHIFEPFFTTKPQGEGTGLGLEISYRIVVDRHRGDIHFESRPGETRFWVRLPISQDRLEYTTGPLPPK